MSTKSAPCENRFSVEACPGVPGETSGFVGLVLRGTARRKVADSCFWPAWVWGSAVRRPMRMTLFTGFLLRGRGPGWTWFVEEEPAGLSGAAQGTGEARARTRERQRKW